MIETEVSARSNVAETTARDGEPSPLDEAIEHFEEKRAEPDTRPARDGRKPQPKLAGGGQFSFRLTGRITRYVEDRSLRHGVSKAEVVRAMLNAQIDREEALQRSLLQHEADHS